MRVCEIRKEDLSVVEVARVGAMETAMRFIDEYPGSRMEAYRIAAAQVNRDMERIAVSHGLKVEVARRISAKRLCSIYTKEWRNGVRDMKGSGEWLAMPRTWQALVDRRVLAVVRRDIRTAQPRFRAWLAAQVAQYKRSARHFLMVELPAMWARGEPIPGYEGLNWRVNLPVPEGWGYENLLRCLPARAERVILNEGVRAADDGGLLPEMVVGTRAGLWPAAYVMFDDVWLDCLVYGPGADGRLQLCRPLQLGCLDVYTGRRLSWGTKLRTLDAASGRHLQLTEQEMMWTLVDYLHTVGYSERGTVLVVEHGTAAIPEAVEDRLYDLTHGLVRVERSGIVGKEQVGAFEGRGVGNYRFKAELESWHNLLHNRMDNLAMHVGHNRREPETLWGIMKAEERILRAINDGKVDEAAAEGVAHYALDMQELCAKLAQIVAAINNRRNHELKGWRECGFMMREFLVAGEWKAEVDIEDAEELAFYAARAGRYPGMVREVAMSPQEVWEREVRREGNGLRRLSVADCLALVGTEGAFPVVVHGGAIRISAKRRHWCNLVYSSRVVDSLGMERELGGGERYRAVFNPFSQALMVMDDRGRVLGEAPLMQAVKRTDREGMERELGRVRARRAEILARVANGGQRAQMAVDEEKMKYNEEVIAGVGDSMPRLTERDRVVLRKLERGGVRVDEGKGVGGEGKGCRAALGLADEYEPGSFEDF